MASPQKRKHSGKIRIKIFLQYSYSYSTFSLRVLFALLRDVDGLFLSTERDTRWSRCFKRSLLAQQSGTEFLQSLLEQQLSLSKGLQRWCNETPFFKSTRRQQDETNRQTDRQTEGDRFALRFLVFLVHWAMKLFGNLQSYYNYH